MARAKDSICLLVGTRKGAFVFTSKDGRRRWKASGPHLKGNEVHHMAYDPRTGKILAAISSGHWGPTIAESGDLGGEWKVSKTPPKFDKGSGLSVAKLWQVTPGSVDEPDVLYAGVEPACLFRSDDGGKSWSVNEALLNHKTRKKWMPGGGGLNLHTILLNPKDPKKMHIAISSVGTMYTRDGGATWEFQNKNVLADFSPVKYPVFGQCTHKLAANPSNPEVIFQQNHCGVYRSDDSGKNWIDIRNNLPSRFGFPVAVDANEPQRAYVAPMEGDFSRIPPGGHFAVWGTNNAGKEWFKLDSGLPDRSYFLVLRDGMATDQEDPCGIYFGTSTGQVYASRDQGEHWGVVSDTLPPVLSVSVSRT